MRLELAHRARPCVGEVVNGDAAWEGSWLGRPAFAVFDASGHGPEAHAASTRACELLDADEGTLDMRALAARLHEGLKGTRGSAGVFAVLDSGMLRGFGVGNVELRALNRPITALLTPGVLGVRLRRRVHEFEIPLHVGDRIIAYSDGIRGRVDGDVHQGLSAADLCDSLLRDHSRPHDDATVLVADVLEDA